MLALCLMFSVTYYAQNYAGIVGWSLMTNLAVPLFKSLDTPLRTVKIKTGFKCENTPDLSCI